MKIVGLLMLPLLLIYLQDDKLAASKERGEEIYNDFCITCHMAVGEGIPGAFPPLAGSDYLLEQTDAAIKAVKYGQEGPLTVNGTTYNGIMTPLYLEDDEVMDVMNFILNSWGNKAPYVTLEKVQSVARE
ncbi:MAG: cytochrome c [Saprospiraceae bacterium]|nr:cytochrome c [Saprospiraceae bacterium]